MIVLLARLEERQKAEKFARKLQRRETARRLEELNHEAARIKAATDHGVSRELFDARMTENDKWKATVTQKIAAWSGGAAVLAWALYWITSK